MNWQSDSQSEAEAATTEASDGVEVGSAGVGIGALCEQIGLSARTLRYYEELGLLPGVRRRSGGRRVYDADAVERLRFIQRLKALGLSLGEIKELNSLYAIEGSTTAMLTRLDDLLAIHLTGLDERIEALTRLRDEMSSYKEHVGARIRGPRHAKPRAQSRNGEER